MTESPPGQHLVDVVDDDLAVCEGVEALLRRCGLASRRFASAEAYLEADRTPAPACLLLDDALPNLDGTALMRRLQTLGETAPVIAITERGNVSAAVRLMQAGAFALLEKPFAVDRLQAAVEEAIKADRQSRPRRRRRDDLARRAATLTERETRVLRLIAAGWLNRAIAEELSVSTRTIESDRSRAVEKFGAKTTGEAIALFSEHATLTGAIGGGAFAEGGRPAPPRADYSGDLREGASVSRRRRAATGNTPRTTSAAAPGSGADTLAAAAPPRPKLPTHAE